MYFVSLSLCVLQETLTKFKRLLSLARRSIEENQRQITEKDSQIAVLREALTAAENAQRRCFGCSERAFLEVVCVVETGVRAVVNLLALLLVVLWVRLLVLFEYFVQTTRKNDECCTSTEYK